MSPPSTLTNLCNSGPNIETRPRIRKLSEALNPPKPHSNPKLAIIFRNRLKHSPLGLRRPQAVNEHLAFQTLQSQKIRRGPRYDLDTFSLVIFILFMGIVSITFMMMVMIMMMTMMMMMTVMMVMISVMCYYLLLLLFLLPLSLSVLVS